MSYCRFGPVHAGHSGEHRELWRYHPLHDGEWVAREVSEAEVQRYWEGRKG